LERPETTLDGVERRSSAFSAVVTTSV
jgi:hypothetical protein